MAAGNFHVRKNGVDETVITTANLDANWDTLVEEAGSIVSYSNPNLRLDTGIYLIQYSEVFYTPTETVDNTNRLEIQGEIHTSTGVQGGYSQGYIRQDSEQFEAALSGSLVLEITADNTDVFIRFYRTDNSTETVQRKSGNGGISVLQLDDAHNYGLYRTSVQESCTGTTVKTLNLDISDREDTGFSRSGSAVSINTTGTYLMRYELDIYQTATGREGIIAYLTRGGVAISGTYGFCYLRGSDSTQDGALTWIGLVDVTAGDVIDVRYQDPDNATIYAKSGAKLQIWQLPSAAETVRLDGTGGENFNGGELNWTTSQQIDTSAFTYTNGNANIQNDYGTHLLAFATMSDVDDSVARGYPEARFSINGITQDYAVSGLYQRNNGVSRTSMTVSGLIPSVPVNSDISIITEQTAATGTSSNDNGQFALIALESIWNYSYAFPPYISSAPAQIDIGDTSLDIVGGLFGSTQGTGKLEIGDNPNYAIAMKVEQSIVAWTDTKIQFDATLSGLSEGPVWIFVTNDDGNVSTGYRVNFGVPSYLEVMTGLNPDILHTFDNTYADVMGVAAANSQTSSGVYSFKPDQMCRGAEYAWSCDDTASRIEMNDTQYTNITNTHTKRLIGGWIKPSKVYLVPSGFYEEGGGVNNLYMVIGFGNILLGNVADSNGSPAFKVQAFSDFKLTPNREYHAVIKFIGGDKFTMFVDGVEVQKTDGNPITDTTMSTHSGDYSYGKPDGTLDTGGTDIQYPSAEDFRLSYFATWSGLSTTFPTDTQIRTELFEKGAVATDAIAGDTEVNMQTSLDLLANTDYVDKPLPLKINKNGSNLRLVLDNITFDSRCSIHVQWMGTVGQELTIVNNGSSNCDLAMCSMPYGGTVVIENPAVLTVQGVIAGSIIEIYDNEVSNLENHDTKLAFDNNSGTSFQYSHNGANNDIIVKMFANGYEEVVVPFTLNSSDQTLTLIAEKETNG